jgi:hypothetical protein
VSNAIACNGCPEKELKMSVYVGVAVVHWCELLSSHPGPAATGALKARLCLRRVAGCSGMPSPFLEAQVAGLLVSSGGGPVHQLSVPLPAPSRCSAGGALLRLRDRSDRAPGRWTRLLLREHGAPAVPSSPLDINTDYLYIVGQ